MKRAARAPMFPGVEEWETTPSGLRYSIRLVTPAEAAERLKNSDKGDVDGSVFRRKVERMADAMGREGWRLNGDTVIVGKSGRLLDGRARMAACVKSGKPFPAIVVTHVDDSAYVSIDAHSRRTSNDVLLIDKVEHSNIVSTAWQAAASYVNTFPREDFRYQGKSAVTTEDITLLTDRYGDEMEASADFVVNLKVGRPVPNTVLTACHFLASLVDRVQADAFFREYADAAPNGRTAPAVLRKRVSAPNANTTFTYRMAVFSKAWSAFLAGRRPTLSEIDYKGRVERKGNLGNEAFPAVEGIPHGLRYDLEAMRVDQARSVKPGAGYRMNLYKNVTVREVLVTRSYAERALQRNGPKGVNRRLRMGHVDDMILLIRDGLWSLNGKTIKISRDDDLLDGQHRLYAAFKGDVSFRTLVVSGLEPDIFPTLDLGERKSLGSRLRAGGDASGKQVNSVVTTLWRIAKGQASGEPSPVQAEQLYRADKEAIDASVAFVKAERVRRILDVSIAGALHVLFAKVDRAKADAFMVSVAQGADLNAGTPLHKLREHLISDGLKKTAKMTHGRKVRAVVKGWNAHVQGLSARRLDFKDEGETGYPEVLGTP